MLNVVFLLLLVFHGNAALKEYAVATELSPRRLFHLLVAKTSFNCQYQRLYQSVRPIAATKSQECESFLLGDSDRLRSLYLQHCAAHSSVNLMPIFSTEQAVSTLAQGKRRRTRTFYNSSTTQLYLNSYCYRFGRKKALEGAL